MTSQGYAYLDGNAAAGELSRIFAFDITAARGQCAHCGANRRFAEAQLYMKCPGLVARCAGCEHVLLRLVNAGGPTSRRAWHDLSCHRSVRIPGLGWVVVGRRRLSRGNLSKLVSSLG